MTKQEIEAMVEAGTLGMKEAFALIEEIGRQSAKAEMSTRELKCKLGEKGGVSVTGLNVKFPITLYGDQWLRLLNFAEQIREFIWANRQAMSWKEGKPMPTSREQMGLSAKPSVKLAKSA